MGTHLVVIPYDTLKFAEKTVIFAGGTKEEEGLKNAARVQVRGAVISALISEAAATSWEGRFDQIVQDERGSCPRPLDDASCPAVR
jgi:hypothetical protein